MAYKYHSDVIKYYRKWRVINKQKLNEKARSRYRKNITKEKLRHKVWVSKNRKWIREYNRKRRKTHPISPEYYSWSGMRTRCNNPKSKDYAIYGGRGIKVCDRWDSFKLFYQDMGRRPDGKTLDRIDTNGNYEPSNCRWATPKEQQSNRRNKRELQHSKTL